MSAETDDFVLRVEQVALTDRRRRFEDDVDGIICLSALTAAMTATPESADALYGQKRLKQRLLVDGDEALRCGVDGCYAMLYPTFGTENVIEHNGNRWSLGEQFDGGPAADCRFKDFCLKEAWEVGKEVTAKPLRDAVRKGAYEFLSRECELIDGGSFPGGNRCPVPGCTLTAGFSEDGVGGTTGMCARETADNQKEAPVEPLPEQIESD